MRHCFLKSLLLFISTVILFIILSVASFAAGFSPSNPAYQKLAAAIENLSPSADLTDCDLPTADVKSLISQIMEDEPEFSYVSQYVTNYNTSTNFVTSIDLSYTPYAQSAYDEREAYHKELDRIAALCDPKWSDLAKALFVHDYIVAHYDYPSKDTGVHHLGFHLLLHGEGVCEAYAEVYQKVMTRLGIECIYVQSDTLNHEWNAVKIDGKWYHVDLTWDDPTLEGTVVYGNVSHNYFMLSDTAIQTIRKKDEIPHIGYDIPVSCSSDIYDSAFWRDVTGVIAYDGSSFYFANPEMDMTKNEFHLYKATASGEKTKLATISYPWFVGSNLYIAPFMSLWYQNGFLYYNSATSLCRYEISTKKVTELAQRPNKDVSLCFAILDGNILKADARNMSDFSKVSTVSVDITAHFHVFDQKSTNSKYLASAATYKSAAFYYYSCTCGEKGTETFTYGSPLVTTAVTTTVKPIVTTQPVTTVPIVTTLPVATTTPITTLPITTSAISTSEITTDIVTSTPVTSVPSTTYPSTTTVSTTTVSTTTAALTNTSTAVVSTTTPLTVIPTTPAETTPATSPEVTKKVSENTENGNPKLVRIIVIVACALTILAGSILLISRKKK